MMKFSLKRVSAIVRKEYMDLMKNYQITIMLAVPPVYAAIFLRLGAEGAEIARTCIMMALLMVGMFIQANMISEEKEKDTLRGLMLSPASVGDVLAGKSFITFILTAAVCTFCLALANISMNISLMVLVICIGILLFISMGTLIGLIAQSVSALNTIIVPVMFFLMFGSMFAESVDNEVIRTILMNLPTTHIMKSVTSVIEGKAISELTTPLLVMTGWFLCLVVASVIVYRKKNMD